MCFLHAAIDVFSFAVIVVGLSCCFFCCRCCWCCLLSTVLITVAAVANLKYSGECVSSSWKTFSMEFSLSHVRLVRYVLTRKSNYSKYVKKDPPQFEIRATCTWKHVFKSLSATYVYILKFFLLICSDLSIFAVVHALSTVVYLFFWFFFSKIVCSGLYSYFFSYIFLWFCLNAIKRLMS